MKKREKGKKEKKGGKRVKPSKPFQLHELCMLRGLETALCVSPPAVQFLC